MFRDLTSLLARARFEEVEGVDVRPINGGEILILHVGAVRLRLVAYQNGNHKVELFTQGPRQAEVAAAIEAAQREG